MPHAWKRNMIRPSTNLQAVAKSCGSILWQHSGWGGFVEHLSRAHRHLRYIDCITARTACLVCFISTVNSRSKRKRKEACLLTIKIGASSRHITKLKQSLLLRCLWSGLRSATKCEQIHSFNRHDFGHT
jgi:hypothetical protein